MKNIKWSKLPVSVRNDIEEWISGGGELDYGANGNFEMAEISVYEALDAYLKWNGIIGYTSTIYSIFEAAK